jgi:hypothetical protein
MISLSFADEHDVNRVVTAVLAIIAVATERKVLVFLDIHVLLFMQHYYRMF